MRRFVALLIVFRTVHCVLLRPERAIRGWNSFDSTGTANETHVLQVIAALRSGAIGNNTGYEYIEIDGFWFSSRTEANSESLDAFGRPCHGPDHYPSLNCSMKPLADAAHAAGLKVSCKPMTRPCARTPCLCAAAGCLAALRSSEGSCEPLVANPRDELHCFRHRVKRKHCRRVRMGQVGRVQRQHVPSCSSSMV